MDEKEIKLIYEILSPLNYFERMSILVKAYPKLSEAELNNKCKDIEKLFSKLFLKFEEK